MEKELSLEIKNVSKSFPGVQALADVSVEAFSGEVLGIVGVNGAGKSTLMNVLGGVVYQDRGKVLIEGKEVEITSPKIAEDLGIAFIQQEIQLFSTLTVADNIFLVDLDKMNKFKRFPLLNREKMFQESKKYLEMLGCDVNPKEKISKLAVGEQQMVQIARALSQSGKILLFDEPTSSLSLNEKEKLFEVIKRLRDNNIAIIYITHHIDEIFQICDKVLVLRDGKVVGNRLVKEIKKEDVTNLMLGKNVDVSISEDKKMTGDVLLEVKNLTGEKMPRDISFKIYSGEILGIWGILGSGRTETIKCMLGFDKIINGTIFLKDNGNMRPIRPRELRRISGYVTESRNFDGLFLPTPIWKNMTSVNLRKFARSIFSVLNVSKEKEETRNYIKKINVAASDENMIVNNLSGGNQQKIAISKWFLREPKVLFLDEPTKGVDIGAKSEIQKLIFNMSDSGISFVLISSEIEEIVNLCDRIIILNEGRIATEVKKGEYSKDLLMNKST